METYNRPNKGVTMEQSYEEMKQAIYELTLQYYERYHKATMEMMLSHDEDEGVKEICALVEAQALMLVNSFKYIKQSKLFDMDGFIVQVFDGIISNLNADEVKDD